MSWTALHISRAFSAEPTLGDYLGPGARVVELPLAEALTAGGEPEVIWLSDAPPEALAGVRHRFPASAVLVTVTATAEPRVVLEAYRGGADLVLRDEGVMLAAAALTSLARRRLATGHGPRPTSDNSAA